MKTRVLNPDHSSTDKRQNAPQKRCFRAMPKLGLPSNTVSTWQFQAFGNSYVSDASLVILFAGHSHPHGDTSEQRCLHHTSTPLRHQQKYRLLSHGPRNVSAWAGNSFRQTHLAEPKSIFGHDVLSQCGNEGRRKNGSEKTAVDVYTTVNWQPLKDQHLNYEPRNHRISVRKKVYVHSGRVHKIL